MFIEHFFLAQNSSVDRETNSLSIFNLIEEIAIQVPQGHRAQIPAQAIIVFHRLDEQGAFSTAVRFEVKSPSGETLVQQEMVAKFGEKHQRQRLRINFAFTVPQAGEYTFRVSGEDGLTRDLLIPVKTIPQVGGSPPQQ